MFDLMDEDKIERVSKAKSELENILNELREESNEPVPTDDYIPVNTAIYYLERAINYGKYNR